ncbi:MAG TPA: P-loop NTPase [Chitinivibrionales bacterium]|nr:P-loop NTPase [Chitinivibrionales bacterium]
MYWGDKNVIAVGSGKAGIGKTTFVANLGVSMAAAGKNVVVIDADTGATNLHTLLGVTTPQKTLDDFLNNHQTDLSTVLADTPYPNLMLLGSASGVLSLASPNYSERQRLFHAIQKLKADVIIFDIAAAPHQRATDFFSLAPAGIILIEPAAATLDSTFSFIKNLLVRGLVRRFYHDKEITAFIQETVSHSTQNSLRLNELLAKLEEKAPGKVSAYRQLFLEGVSSMFIVTNSVKNVDQKAEGTKFARRVKRELAFHMGVLGSLPYEPSMSETIAGRVPFVAKSPRSDYSKKMSAIASKIITLKPPESPQ